MKRAAIRSRARDRHARDERAELAEPDLVAPAHASDGRVDEHDQAQREQGELLRHTGYETQRRTGERHDARHAPDAVAQFQLAED